MLPLAGTPCARSALLCLALAASACGFHLRGEGRDALDIGADRIYVDDSNAEALAREVRSQLLTAGVKVTSTASKAQYIVVLSNEGFHRDVLSVSPRTGKVEEYQVTLSARLSIRDEHGKVLLDRDNLSLVRDYTFDQGAVLGKVSEEETLRADLTRDVAEQALRRISAVLSSTR